MNLTGIQLAAVLKAGMLVSNADGNIDPKELEVLKHELGKFDLSDELHDKIVDVASEMSVDDMVANLKKLSLEDQKYVSGYLAAVLLADGEIEDEEIKTWQAICTLCEFPTMSAREALDFWMNN